MPMLAEPIRRSVPGCVDWRALIAMLPWSRSRRDGANRPGTLALRTGLRACTRSRHGQTPQAASGGRNMARQSIGIAKISGTKWPLMPPLYEDRDARISILATAFAMTCRIRSCRPISACTKAGHILAPEAYWWARMMVKSITTQSRSASLARASNSLSSTLISIQR